MSKLKTKKRMKKSSKIQIPETRGRSRKYDFESLKIGDKIQEEVSSKHTASSLLHCAKRWANQNSKKWSFRTYTIANKVTLIRVK